MRAITHSAEETVSLGVKFSSILKDKDVILLEGELGAGKTTFVQGVMQGLGYKHKVTSPSFTLMRLYRVKPACICHVDLYRLGADDIFSLGIEDWLGVCGHIALIEWGGKIAHLLKEYITVSFKFNSQEKRLVTFSFKNSPGRKKNEFIGA
ncbi:MAG: tRNA (adenosine(37)-N6)-threonylcarbamoyltransferase complex ATPase subunit type 1 TsaE [Candidatus Omnitrophota bacterium]